ncbi:hypothetical protein ACPW96_22825 [Micromonospora sp. DT81.3]|uniref:hypothetical protein n=1 Tax=Micromonospora sp. DT81.3 TaxID=3416523 RepID=UPI003CEF832A
MALNKAQAARQTAAMFEGLTGQKLPDVSRDTRSMLRFLFPGPSDRFPIATKLAAEKLGVSQRTVQRWSRGAQTPRTEITKEITKRVRQAVTTKRGRAQLAKRMTAQLPNKIRTIRVQALQGPSSDPLDKDYVTDRYSNFEMSPDEQQRLYDAWVQGGDTAATDYLAGLYDTRYVDGWQFHGIKGVDWL